MHFFFLWRCDPTRVMASSFLRFLDQTQRRTAVGRTPLDEWSARRIDLYLTTHDTHNRQTSMPPGGIRTHDLNRRAAADLLLRPRGHWDRHQRYISLLINVHHLVIYIYIYIFFLLWRCDPTRVIASSFLRFLDHTQRRTIVGMTPLDEWSARRRDLYLTKHDTHNIQISMPPPVGFEPTTSEGERPQTARLRSRGHTYLA